MNCAATPRSVWARWTPFHCVVLKLWSSIPPVSVTNPTRKAGAAVSTGGAAVSAGGASVAAGAQAARIMEATTRMANRENNFFDMLSLLLQKILRRKGGC